MVRKTVLYAGRVQGVFFRATARDLARSFAVTGFVRNLPDGRVQIIAEGAPDEIDRFLDAVRSAKQAHIINETIDTASATGEFADFRVAY